MGKAVSTETERRSVREPVYPQMKSLNLVTVPLSDIVLCSRNGANLQIGIARKGHKNRFDLRLRERERESDRALNWSMNSMKGTIRRRIFSRDGEIVPLFGDLSHCLSSNSPRFRCSVRSLIYF